MVNRIGGLASGMDIDALVAKLMQAEKSPLIKLQQKKLRMNGNEMRIEELIQNFKHLISILRTI